MESKRTATTYFIPPGKFMLMENALGNPDLIQSSVSSDCRVTIVDSANFPLDELEQWPTFRLTSADIKLKLGDGAYYIYIVVPTPDNTESTSAFISYNTALVDREGYQVIETEDEEGNPKLEKVELLGKSGFKYYQCGVISARGGNASVTTSPSGQGRLLEMDLGVTPAPSNLPGDLNDFDKIFKLDKVDLNNPSSWLLTILTTISTMTARLIRVTGSLIFGTGESERRVTNVAVKSDVDKDTSVSDTVLASTAWVDSKFEELDDRFISKIKDDETPYSLGVGKNLTVGENLEVKGNADVDGDLSVGGGIASKDYAEGTLKGGYAIHKNEDGEYESEADNVIARILAKTYDLLVQNHATFVGDLSSEEFISGFLSGKGWSIRIKEWLNAAGVMEKKSVAEFDDLIIRGSMRVYEFIVSQLLGENDNRVFTGMMEVDHYDAADGKIYLKTDNGKLYNPFRVDDVIIVQQYGQPTEDNGYYVTKQYELIVTEAKVGDISKGEDRLDWITFSNFTTPIEGGSESLIAERDTLVRIDNLTNNDRKGIIQMMSAGKDTPYMDFIYGKKTDPENSLKGRLGNLGGISNPLFGPLKDFGAYLTSLYAVGEFVIAHTGEDVSDTIEIAKGQFRTNFRQSTYDMSEEQNFFTNAAMTNNCEHWILGEDVTSFFTVDEFPQFFNYDLYSTEETYSGMAEWKGRDMLRLSKSSIMQSNSLIDKAGTHKVYTGSVENADGSYTETYEEVADTLYLSVRFFVSVSGKLEFGFVENGNFIDNSFHYSSNVTAREDGYEVKLSGIWDGKGDFTITSTGDIYVDLLSLTDKPLDNFKITTETKIEQDATRISLLGKKINGVEGSVTYLGIELNAVEEQIRLYVNKVGELESSVSSLEVSVQGIRTTVASVQGTATDAKNLANAAQSAANDAASKALAAQTTANSANSKADANATAIAQTESSISLLAGAFTLKGGKYVLTSAAGAVITSEVASLYATKSTVDSLGNRVTTAEASIKVSADNINLKVSKNGVVAAINASPESVTISANRIDLSGVVTSTAFNNALSGYATDSELSAAQTTLNKSISDLNTTLSTQINAKASTESLNTKVSELNTAISKKADTSSLGSVAYMNDIANAACNGSTLIVGGYINADLLRVEKIYADEGTVGGLTIESDKIVGKGTNGEMILSADIDGGYPGLTWKSDEQTLIGLQTHLLNGYKSSVLRLADNASEQSMLTPGYMDIDGKGGEIIINTTLSNEVTISINKSYKVNNVPMSYKMALGMDSNGLVRIGGQKWARSASEVQVGELWVDEDNYVKVRTS